MGLTHLLSPNVALGLKGKKERVACFGSSCHGMLCLGNYHNSGLFEKVLHWQVEKTPEKQLHLPNIYVVKFGLGLSFIH